MVHNGVDPDSADFVAFGLTLNSNGMVATKINGRLNVEAHECCRFDANSMNGGSQSPDSFENHHINSPTSILSGFLK